MVIPAPGQATEEGDGVRQGLRRDRRVRATHRGCRFPSRHDADQREVLGLIAAEGGWCVRSHHFDGGGRSYPKGKHRKTEASVESQESSLII